MSTDFSIRPVGVPVAPSFPPAVGNAALGGVATQLPANQTVTATDASSAGRNDSSSPNVDLSHQAFFDTAAASFVFEVVSITGQVVQQFPDEAVLRRRAYFHALDLTKEESLRPITTDLKA